MTNDRGMLVLNTTSLSNDISDNYFVYKATLRDFHEFPHLPTWTMGSRSLWKFDARYHQKQRDDDSDSFEDSNDVEIEIN